jgi:hypothetical protein
MLIQAKQVKNFSYIVIDNMYEEDELAEIKKEIVSLLEHVKTPEETGAAVYESTVLKKSSGLFVDDLYLARREQSALLTFNRKLFCDEIVREAVKLNLFYKILNKCDYDRTILNFYQTGDEYKPHVDSCPITAITFFALGDIHGGDLTFPESNETVCFKENRTVIFSGCALHATTPVVTEPDGYRVSMAQFLTYTI